MDQWRAKQEAESRNASAYLGGARVGGGLNIEARDAILGPPPARMGIHEAMAVLENEIDDAYAVTEALAQSLANAGVLRAVDKAEPNPGKAGPQVAPMLDRIDGQRYRVAEVRRLVQSLRDSLAF